MRIFISGGCKNGKSTLAQRLAARQQLAGEPLCYLATMCPVDAEDRARVVRHQQERAGMGFVTVECPRQIGALLGRFPPRATLLLDSLTALLGNEMFGETGFDPAAPQRVADELAALLSQYKNLVLVSDYIYSDAESFDELTEAYRRGLALLDRRCAALCDGVVEVSGALPIFHKGGKQLETLW